MAPVRAGYLVPAILFCPTGRTAYDRRVRPSLLLMILLSACLADEGDGPVPSAGPDASIETPTGAYCDPTEGWPTQSATWEAQVVDLVNMHRLAGAVCSGQYLPAVEPLQMVSSLQCAARLHSMDMAQRGYFKHKNPEGEEAWDRMERAGYTWTGAAENITTGSTPEGAVDAWMKSTQGHCENIMANYEHIGVGYYQGLWTQVFGTD
jgi:uncharacterized protein YkwD